MPQSPAAALIAVAMDPALASLGSSTGKGPLAAREAHRACMAQERHRHRRRLVSCQWARIRHRSRQVHRLGAEDAETLATRTDRQWAHRNRNLIEIPCVPAYLLRDRLGLVAAAQPCTKLSNGHRGYWPNVPARFVTGPVAAIA